jgi:hypothetical protein
MRSPSGYWLLLGVLILAGGAKAILYDTLDPDLFWHLRVADQLAAQPYPRPLVDDLSFASMKSPWTPYSWLADLGMKRLWDHDGYRTAIAGQAIMTGAIVLLIALTSLEMSWIAHGQPRYLASAMAAFAGEFLCLPYLSFRPVTFALLLLALIAWLLVRDRRMKGQSRAVWLIIPLTILLANVHLYAVFVPLAVLAWAWPSRRFKEEVNRGGADPNPPPEYRERGIKPSAIVPLEDKFNSIVRFFSATSAPPRLILFFFACCASCLLTPMLPGVIAAAWHYQFADVMVTGHVIAEMQPFYRGQLGWAAVAVVLIILIAAFTNRRSLQTYQWLWLIGSFAVMLRIGRFAPIFAILAAPTLAVTLPRLSDAVLSRPITRALLAAVLLTGGLRVALKFPRSDVPMSAWVNRLGPDLSGYPIVAADFVEKNVPPRTHRLINEFTWGGYLEWRLNPNFQTLMDGRTQLFAADFWNQLYLGNPSERQAYLRSLTADAAILPVKGSVFRQDLLDLGWRVIFSDDRAVVLAPPPVTATSTPRNGQCTAAPGNAS